MEERLSGIKVRKRREGCLSQLSNRKDFFSALQINDSSTQVASIKIQAGRQASRQAGRQAD